MKKDIFEAQTVIATVDPKTGALRSLAPRDSGSVVDLNRRVYAKLDPVFFEKIQEEEKAWQARESGAADAVSDDLCEATCVVRGSSEALPKGAQYRITKDCSASGEKTVLWQDKPVHGPSLYPAYAAQYVKHPKNRRLLLLLLIAATILLFVIAGRRSTGGPAFEMMQSAAAEVVPPASPSVKSFDFESGEIASSRETVSLVDLKRSTAPSNTTPSAEDELPKPVVRLKDAIVALKEGRIKDSLQQYASLLEQSPDEPSYRLILKILQTDWEKRQ